MTTDSEQMEDGAAKIMPLAEAARLRMVDARKTRFSTAGARLDMTVEGEKTYERVTIRRAFPLSAPASHYSVRDADNKEIAMLRGIEGMDRESRRLVDMELERRYMVAIIRKIAKVTERFGTVDWDVETDRGSFRFTTRDLRSNAIRVGAGHYLFTDVENNRFEVPDLKSLDPESRSLLIRHL